MRITDPRTTLASFVFLPFLLAALVAGCASSSNDIAPDRLTCDQLAAEMSGTRVARVQAVEKQQDPWAFVIPFAVAGRHVAAASSVNDADRYLGELGAERQRKGCAPDLEERHDSIAGRPGTAG